MKCLLYLILSLHPAASQTDGAWLAYLRNKSTTEFCCVLSRKNNHHTQSGLYSHEVRQGIGTYWCLLGIFVLNINKQLIAVLASWTLGVEDHEYQEPFSLPMRTPAPGNKIFVNPNNGSEGINMALLLFSFFNFMFNIKW